MARPLSLLVLGRNPDFISSLKVYFPTVWVYVVSLLVLLLFYCRTSLFLRLVYACSHSMGFLIAKLLSYVCRLGRCLLVEGHISLIAIKQLE
jgi:hypothetical protein